MHNELNRELRSPVHSRQRANRGTWWSERVTEVESASAYGNSRKLFNSFASMDRKNQVLVKRFMKLMEH